MSIQEYCNFNERLVHLKKTFPDIPEVKYYNLGNSEKDSLNVYRDGEKADLRAYPEVMIVGNKVINVTGNSTEFNLELVFRAFRSMEITGFIGKLK